MKIVINGLSARTGGGVVYLRNILRALLGKDQENEYLLFVSSGIRPTIEQGGHRRLSVIEVRLPNRFVRLLYEQVILPVRLFACHADVLYAPAEIASLLAPCPVVLGLQNANIYRSDSVRRPLTDRLRNWVLLRLAWVSARRARALVFVSETSRREIAAALHVEPNRGTVIHHGIDPLFIGQSRHDSLQVSRSKGGSVLSVSAIAPHKNVECLVEAYANLDKVLRGAHELILVGPIVDRLYYRRLVKALRSYGMNPDGVFCGEVALEELPSIYKKASVFVFPSVLETFGLPLLEAMACGAPVVASEASCIPEIVGEAALLFDPTTPLDLKRGLERVLSDLTIQRDLMEKGYHRVSLFTWERAAEKLLRVFARVVRTGNEAGGNR